MEDSGVDLREVFQQILGLKNASKSIQIWIFAIGLICLSCGLFLKFNFGLLILYVFLSTLLSIAQYKRTGVLIALILMAPIMILAMSAKFYELLYLFGCLLIGYSLVIKTKE